MNEKYNNYLYSLLGKAVKFRIGNKRYIGFVCSIEKDVANIRLYSAGKSEKPKFHLLVGEIRELSQKEAIQLGREMEAGHL